MKEKSITLIGQLVRYNRFKFFLIYEVLGLFLIAGIFSQLFIISIAPIDCDEMEHLHASWLVYKGKIPYKDFFEHHNPLFWYILIPFFFLFRDNVLIFPFTRIFMLFMNLLILFVTYKIAREWFGRIYSLLVIVLTLFENNYFVSIPIIRPDVPMTLLWLLSFYLFLQAKKYKSNLYIPFISGLFIGLCFDFKQLSLGFLLVPIMSNVVIYFCNKNLKKTRKKFLMLEIFILFIGFMLAVAPLYIYFYLEGAINDLFYDTIVFNLSYNLTHPIIRIGQIFVGFLNDPGFWILGFVGIINHVLSWKNLKERDVILLTSIFILFFLLMFSKVMWYYRYLPLIPLMSIYVVFIIRNVLSLVTISKYRLLDKYKNNNSMLILIPLVCLLFVFSVAKPFCEFLFGVESKSIYFLVFKNNITNQYKTMELVWNITNENDKVFDGYGMYIYREHGYKYWFMHEAIFNFSYFTDIPLYLNKTETKVVIYDKRVKRLPPNVKKFINEFYVPIGKYDVYVVGKVFYKEDIYQSKYDYLNFYILASGCYDILIDLSYCETTPKLYLDDKLVSFPSRIYLPRGVHKIKLLDYNNCVEKIIIRYSSSAENCSINSLQTY